MSVDVAQFLKNFPAFDTSEVTDPNAPQISTDSINFWLTIAYQMLNAERWDTMLDLGAELFTAHHVTLEALEERGMQTSGLPGVSKGAVAGKSAGDVAITYDTGSVLEIGAGHWNYTTYGKRFYRLVMMFGMGPLQIGTGCGYTLFNPLAFVPMGAPWLGPAIGNGLEPDK